eukprot:12121743-Alexandrium_andersonii.AAC.1
MRPLGTSSAMRPRVARLVPGWGSLERSRATSSRASSGWDALAVRTSTRCEGEGEGEGGPKRIRPTPNLPR